MLTTPVTIFGSVDENLQHVTGGDLELLHDRSAIGDDWRREVERHIARDPDIALRIQGKGADADAHAERFRLGRIVGREPDDRVRLRVADPDAILSVDDDVEGRLQPRDLDDAAVLDRARRERTATDCPTPSAIQTSPFAATPMPMSPRNFSLNGKSLSVADRFTVEIHHENLAVEARDPDAVVRHGRAPADAVDAHAGEAGDRRRERGPVGREA